jgi:competence protein ComGC
MLMFSKNKKAVEMSITLVAVVVIILVIIVIMIYIVGNTGKTIKSSSSCESRGGVCADKAKGCDVGYRPEVLSCKTETIKEGICCVKED